MMNKATDTRPPFFPIEDAILDYELSPYEGWLYVVIVKHANRKTGESFPGIARMAKLAKMSRTKVIESIQVLETKGLIRVDRSDVVSKGEKREREHNHYWILAATKSSTLYVLPSAQNELGSQQSALGVVRDVDNNQSYLEPESNNKKKAVSSSKKKAKLTPLQKALAELKPNTVLADAMLTVLENGYRPGFHTPETYMTLPHLEEYLPALEYFRGKNVTPEEICAMHKYLKPGYDKKEWSIGVKTLVKKLEAFRTWRDNGGEKKIITGVWAKNAAPELPDVGLTPEERAAIVASTKKAVSA